MSLTPPSVHPPELPAWPKASWLTRSRAGEPFFVGQFKVDTKIGEEPVSDGRLAYIEVADGHLEGVMGDQRGMLRKVVGRVSPDGAFELREDGQTLVMVRGTRQGDEIKGDLLVSVWGAFSDYAAQGRRFPFAAERLSSTHTLDGIKNGMIGKVPVRMRFTPTANGAIGEARYQRGEVSRLEGHYDSATDRLIIEETRGGQTMGIMRLVVFGSWAPAYGVWTSADGSQSFFVAFGTAMDAAAAVPLTSTLRIEPRFVLYFGRSCIFDHSWPLLVGAGPNLEKVNRELAAWSMERLEAPTCNEESIGPISSRPFYEQATYIAHPLREGRFGLELSHWFDGNGAHGLGSKRCLLGDPKSGRIVEPAQLINDDKRPALTALVTKKLLAFSRVKSMAELRSGNGGTDDGPDEAPVTPETDICMTEKGVDVSFEVYEIGPYSMNAPLVSLTRAEARPFFVQDELIAAVLR